MTVKTIKAGVLESAYEDQGPADGWPCILGHGFPYDIHAYAQTAPILARAGARASGRRRFSTRGMAVRSSASFQFLTISQRRRHFSFCLQAAS